MALIELALPDVGRSTDVLPHIQSAYSLAWKKGVYIWDAPIWPENTPMHFALRDRWLHHGDGEAGFYALLCRLDPYFINNANGYLGDIFLGQLLHDYGKGLIGDNTVWKTPKENLQVRHRIIIQRHVTYGIGLLKFFETFSQSTLHPVSFDIVALHHEKIDGSGPYKLKGHNFPWHGRLAAIIDQLISRLELREYKNGYPNFNTLPEAFADVYKDRGVLYDSEILDRIAPHLTILEKNLIKHTVQDSRLLDVMYTRWYMPLNRSI